MTSTRTTSIFCCILASSLVAERESRQMVAAAARFTCPARCNAPKPTAPTQKDRQMKTSLVIGRSHEFIRRKAKSLQPRGKKAVGDVARQGAQRTFSCGGCRPT